MKRTLHLGLWVPELTVCRIEIWTRVRLQAPALTHCFSPFLPLDSFFTLMPPQAGLGQDQDLPLKRSFSSLWFDPQSHDIVFISSRIFFTPKHSVPLWIQQPLAKISLYLGVWNTVHWAQLLKICSSWIWKETVIFPPFFSKFLVQTFLFCNSLWMSFGIYKLYYIAAV